MKKQELHIKPMKESNIANEVISDVDFDRQRNYTDTELIDIHNEALQVMQTKKSYPKTG